MSPVPTVAGQKAPLEELMVAMDVVDTLRHRQLIVDRELDAAGRRQRLVERLREIYTAQGIEVTDAALEAGVDALEKERFAYSPTPPGLSTALARFYVRRDRWLKPLLALVTLLALGAALWYAAFVLPQSRLEASLPTDIAETYARVIEQSESDTATARAMELRDAAMRAIDAGNFDQASASLAELERLERELALSYEIRIVSRPDELSGVWRVPDVNTSARNYYLIVEAVDAGGNVLPRRVRNEEDGQMVTVRKWGVRVDEATFNAVAADKQADGIVNDFVVGQKLAGQLEPEYVVPSTGATITEW